MGVQAVLPTRRMGDWQNRAAVGEESTRAEHRAEARGHGELSRSGTHHRGDRESLQFDCTMQVPARDESGPVLGKGVSSPQQLSTSLCHPRAL